MLLLIDAGNTRIKWGIPQLATALTNTLPDWLIMDSVAHTEIATLAERWHPCPVTSVLVSNVAGEGVKAQLSDILARIFPALQPYWLASQAQLAGLKNQYRHPQQLGCDRFASAIAAHYLYPQQNLIVTTCGTATTVDAVSADGVFTGGMILPGLKLMAESLARNTAQLPQVAESIRVHQPFADNTDQAIVSGCIHAQTGAITLAYHAFAEEQKTAVTCLISGGAAPYLLPHLDFDCQHIPNLVLTGLYVVAQSSPS
ncbi:type III pantothenate kinase [Undibacterium sp. 14-3-2]|uniref:type III pantothenate kinase n=1 Tax=Undibacterium sp. 14-3-2 TaxID=2800129 RepID=UPI001907BF2D|nr:type III pantothenate kinase [Undibacterium sp. 14-3-2]MBK1888851.1 type III pantothenate kinase [Undibacterium sp. 14-3-2]